MAYNKPIFEMYWYTEDDWSWLKHVVSVKIIGHVTWFRYTLKPFKSGGNETGRMWSERLQPSMSSPKKTLSEYNLMRSSLTETNLSSNIWWEYCDWVQRKFDCTINSMP